MFLVSRRASLFTFLILLFCFSYSQNVSKDSLIHTTIKDSVPETDAIEVINHILHPHKKNDTAAVAYKSHKKYQFSILPGLGYTLQSSFVANVSGNVVFNNGPNDSTNLSAIVGVFLTQQKSSYYFISNLITGQKIMSGILRVIFDIINTLKILMVWVETLKN